MRACAWLDTQRQISLFVAFGFVRFRGRVPLSLSTFYR